MKRIPLAVSLLALCFAALPAAAQISLELRLSRTVFMQYETVFARVKMRNYSGQPLIFGDSKELKGALLFDIRDGSRSAALPPLDAQVYALDGVVLMPGETQTVIVPLNNFYNLNRLGVYRLHAYVRHGQLKDLFKSNELKFEVNPGVTLWNRQVGVPDVLKVAGQKNASPDRTYSVRVMQDRSIRYLFLVIEDEKLIYAVTRIGRETGVEKFKADIDLLSRAHMIVPVAPKVFRYLVVNVNGQLEEERYLKSSAKSNPNLVNDPTTGRVYVVGGAEAIASIDYAPPRPPSYESLTGQPQE